MWKLLILFVSFLLLTEEVRGDAPRARAEEALRRALLENYDVQALPQENNTLTFTGLVVRGIKMREAENSVNIHAWLKHAWMDPRFEWNPSEHDDISQLGFDMSDIWKPDLSVYNAVTAKQTTLEKSGILGIAYSSGKVLFVPPYNLQFHCQMDMTYWPHDKHRCTLVLGSWIHSGLVINLVLDNFEFEFPSNSSEAIDNELGDQSENEWKITEASVVKRSKFYPCCEEPYESLKISFLFARYAPAFAWTVKIPAACLCFLTLVMFLLPPGAGEKVVFGGVCLILNFLYINFTSYVVNYAPTHAPLIVQLVSHQLILVMVSVFVTAIVVRTARDPHSVGLPSYLRGPVIGLARILCLRNYANLKSSSEINSKESEAESGSASDTDTCKKNLNTSEWIILAAVVDRLAFILYLIISIICVVRFSSIL